MKIFRDSLLFSSARYVIMVLSAVRNLVLARVLDPEHFGYWVVLSLVLAYGDLVHGGLRHAGDREIPYFRGQERHDEVVHVERILFGGILFFSSIALLVLSLLGILGIPTMGWPQSALIIAGLVIVAEQVSRFSYMILRTRHEFVLSSKLEIGFEVTRTALVCTLAAFQGVLGALIGFLLAAVLNVGYFGMVLRLPPRPLANILKLRMLLNTGFLLFSVALVQLLILNLDRVIGSFILTPSDLGIYGLAALAMQVPLMFSQSLSTVFVPSASEAFGRRNSLEDVAQLFFRLLRASAVLGPVLTGLVLIVSKVIIHWFLPAYELSVSVIVVLLPGAMLSVLIPPTSALLVIARKAKFLLVLEAAALLGGCMVFWASLRFASGLQALSFGMVAAILWYSSLSMMGAFYPFRFSGNRLLKEVIFNYGPAVYAMVLLFGVIPGILGEGEGPQRSVLELGIFFLSYAPLLLIGFRAVRTMTLPGNTSEGDVAKKSV
ncbi:MAG TPA: oligosaccharide flippase family protein [Bacteroidota bacterium]|nr:oligosaccharide flippase family protein [Bacteroidota bacterium]